MEGQGPEEVPQTAMIKADNFLTYEARDNGWGDSDQASESDRQKEDDMLFDDENRPGTNFDFDDYPGMNRSESVMLMEGHIVEPQQKVLIRSDDFFNQPERKGECDD